MGDWLILVCILLLQHQTDGEVYVHGYSSLMQHFYKAVMYGVN